MPDVHAAARIAYTEPFQGCFTGQPAPCRRTQSAAAVIAGQAITLTGSTDTINCPNIQVGTVCNVTFQTISGSTAASTGTINRSTQTLDANGNLQSYEFSVANVVSSPFSVLTGSSQPFGSSQKDPRLTTGSELVAHRLLTVPSSGLEALDSRLHDLRASRSNGPTTLAQTADGLSFHTGLGSGDPWQTALGFWTNLSYRRVEDDFGPTRFDANQGSAMFGVDWFPSDDIAIGLAVGVEHTEADTDFNSGEMDASGITLQPYVLVTRGPLSFDLAFGYTFLDYSQFRGVGGAPVHSRLDGARWHVAGNGRYHLNHDNWRVTATAGLIYSRLDNDAFVESNGNAVSAFSSNQAQVRSQLDAAYHLGTWEPFAGAGITYDFSETEVPLINSPQPGDDDFGVVVRAGLRYFEGESFSGTFDFGALIGRDDFFAGTASLTIRAKF